MSLDEIKYLSANADMIVCGYAFSKTDNQCIRILQLQPPHHALVISSNGEVLETSMDDVELDIVMGYWQKNQKYLGEAYA